MELITLLKNNPIFSSLDMETLKKLAEIAITRSYESDHWVTHYGDVWPYLFVVHEGIITAIKESLEGRSLIVAQFESGEVFWGLSFFLEDAPTPAALVTTKPSKIHLWSRQQLLPILLKNGQMSWELTTLMVQRMLLASDIVEGLAFQPVAGRLAQFLLDRFGESGVEKVSRNLTLDEMAAYIGTTREMVCRILNKFSNQGLIEITRTEFMFKDRKGLQMFVKNPKV
jgi:CRP/FNR family transcriptional regulator